MKDAFEWIEIGEELAKRKAEPSPRRVSKVAGIADEGQGPEYQAEWLVTEKPKVSLDDIAGMEDCVKLLFHLFSFPFITFVTHELNWEFYRSVWRIDCHYGWPHQARDSCGSALLPSHMGEHVAGHNI